MGKVCCSLKEIAKQKEQALENPYHKNALYRNKTRRNRKSKLHWYFHQRNGIKRTTWKWHFRTFQWKRIRRLRSKRKQSIYWMKKLQRIRSGRIESTQRIGWWIILRTFYQFTLSINSAELSLNILTMFQKKIYILKYKQTTKRIWTWSIN